MIARFSKMHRGIGGTGVQLPPAAAEVARWWVGSFGETAAFLRELAEAMPGARVEDHPPRRHPLPGDREHGFISLSVPAEYPCNSWRVIDYRPYSAEEAGD